MVETRYQSADEDSVICRWSLISQAITTDDIDFLVKEIAEIGESLWADLWYVVFDLWSPVSTSASLFYIAAISSVRINILWSPSAISFPCLSIAILTQFHLIFAICKFSRYCFVYFALISGQLSSWFHSWITLSIFHLTGYLISTVPCLSTSLAP